MRGHDGRLGAYGPVLLVGGGRRGRDRRGRRRRGRGVEGAGVGSQVGVGRAWCWSGIHVVVGDVGDDVGRDDDDFSLSLSTSRQARRQAG